MSVLILVACAKDMPWEDGPALKEDLSFFFWECGFFFLLIKFLKLEYS